MLIKLVLISVLANAQLTKKEDSGYCTDDVYTDAKVCILKNQDCYLYKFVNVDGKEVETIRCFKKK